jgi:hypothetical protein
VSRPGAFLFLPKGALIAALFAVAVRPQRARNRLQRRRPQSQADRLHHLLSVLNRVNI